MEKEGAELLWFSLDQPPDDPDMRRRWAAVKSVANLLPVLNAMYGTDATLDALLSNYIGLVETSGSRAVAIQGLELVLARMKSGTPLVIREAAPAGRA